MTQTEKEAKEIKDLRNGLKRQVSELARLVFEDALNNSHDKYGINFWLTDIAVELYIHDGNTCEQLESLQLGSLRRIFEPTSFSGQLNQIKSNVKKAENDLKNMKSLFLKYKKLNKSN
jgi:uncharacterized membrane protein YheB (UPF0754 family)